MSLALEARSLDSCVNSLIFASASAIARFFRGLAFSKLSVSPGWGANPKELLALGLREYREIFFKPYRIIYRVMDKKVYILLIADGRRDMQSLLQRRLLYA
ncbi:MAG: type II toxin-antitoxin system RelE/ParE family toxin [Desulfobacteraceae bacterium]|nr:MAG: type II toxin-antitoxin system RelE/ParE family toxin [Desulfobacteraceae bacterium]